MQCSTTIVEPPKIVERGTAGVVPANNFRLVVFDAVVLH
jgi:hypothetical protein